MRQQMGLFTLKSDNENVLFTQTQKLEAEVLQNSPIPKKPNHITTQNMPSSNTTCIPISEPIPIVPSGPVSSSSKHIKLNA